MWNPSPGLLPTRKPTGCVKQPQAYLAKACRLIATAHLQLPPTILTPINNTHAGILFEHYVALATEFNKTTMSKSHDSIL
jgi:hypothetical protein